MSPFNPKYTITNRLAAALLKLEGAKERINGLPITPSVLASLRETARLFSTHYSTMIEGNRLTEKDVKAVRRRRALPVRRYPPLL